MKEALIVIAVVGGGWAAAIALWAIGYVLDQLGPSQKDSRK